MPDMWFSFIPHNPKQPDSLSQFTCGLVDNFTLENLILHASRDGLAADTSWRNKNENRAAVTFLIAVDEERHFVPGKFQAICYIDTNLQCFSGRVRLAISQCAHRDFAHISGSY